MAESNPDRWTDELQRNGRVVLKTARGKVAFLLVVSAVLAIFGIIVIAAGEGGTIIGILAVVFFGLLGVPALGWRLATGRPVTVIDYAGVAVDNVGVNWQDVLDVRVFGPKRLVLLDLTPQGQATMANQLRPWHRVVARVETQITGRPAFTLPTDQGVAAEPFAAWLAWLHFQRTGGQPPDSAPG